MLQSQLRDQAKKIVSQYIAEQCEGEGWLPIAYLAGPMEDTKDLGAAWRAEFTSKLHGQAIDVINPFLLEPYQRRLSGVRDNESFTEIKRTDPARFKHIMRCIIILDLEAVSQSNLIVCRWNNERTAGTIHEVGYAFHHLNIPSFLVTTQKREDILGWFWACFEEVGGSLDELMPSIMKHVDKML